MRFCSQFAAAELFLQSRCYPKLFDVLGWVLVLHNHANISVVLFIHPPSPCSWHGCAGEREVFTLLSVLWVVSVTPSDGSGWHGNDTSPSHCRKQGGNSGLNSWLVNKAASRTCLTISKYIFRALCLQPFVVQMLCELNVHSFTPNFFPTQVFFLGFIIFCETQCLIQVQQSKIFSKPGHLKRCRMIIRE